MSNKENKEGAEKKSTSVKKGKSAKISSDDIKEATSASKNVVLSPPDAPSPSGKKASAKKSKSNEVTPPSAPVKEEAFPSETLSTPADIEHIIEHKVEEVVEEVVHEVEESVQEAATGAIEDITDKVVEVLEHAPAVEETTAPTVEIPVEEASTPPSTPEPSASDPVNFEEKNLEKWLNGRTSINHYELAYSSGVNMNHFGLYEARVGKFRFKRSYVGADWSITVEE